jgi:hypothetical protein
VFVPGHPGSTQRLDTVAQLDFERDYIEPTIIKLLKNRIAVLQRYGAQGTEQERQVASNIFGLQNSVKALEGRYTGLLDKHVMDKKSQDEEDFKAKVMANPEWAKAYGSAWTAIADAAQKAQSRVKLQFFRSTDSQFANTAATIVDYVAEVKKPDGERLAGYHEAQLDSLRQRLSRAPVYPAMEIARMTGAERTSRTDRTIHF